MAYYIGIRHQGGEEDAVIISTSRRAVSEFLGISDRKLGYWFTEKGSRFWTQLNPHVSVWMTDNFVKQRRPQYSRRKV